MTSQAGRAPEQGSVDFTALAAPLRSRLAEISAEAVGDLPQDTLPQPVRPVARFAPAKRARAGAGVLVSALAGAAFRAQVRDWAGEHRPELLRIPDDDAVAAAAAALLDGDPVGPYLAELVADRGECGELRAARDDAVAKLERASSELERARAGGTETGADAERRAQRAAAEADRLRGRLREQGSKLRAARDEADAASAALSELRAETDLEVKRVEAERDAERARCERQRGLAKRAQQEADTARQVAAQARAADESRLALLVETIEGAAAGLRGELSVGGVRARPADEVSGATVASRSTSAVRDPGALDGLLRMRAAHLIVDGYNVTKTGYPELSLADQRDRLARQLAALAARTGAEMTVVFDGAGVVAHRTWPRGVRVLFSEPGVLADDVIRDLVAAEPQGRPLVVATSDQEVVDSVRASGAQSVASSVLVNRLMRG